MCLFLDRFNHLHEAADIAGGHPARDRLLEVVQVIVHLSGDAPALRGGGDDEGAAILLADGAGD